MMKRVSSILLALVLVVCLGAPAMAADSEISYKGHNIFGIGPGSEYTETDLFDGFKGVMPGDELTENVTVKNEANCCDFIKVYLRAVPHGVENPLSPAVAESETVETMNEFLSQLTMTIYNGGTGEEFIYQDSPEQTGALTENVLLGTFRRGQGTTLTVCLEVPIEMGDEFANRAGEVDWVLLVEEYDDAKPDIPSTGDHSSIGIYIAIMAVCLVVMILIVVIAIKRKKKNG